jgi:heme oxygenase (mycobilin-producing)
VRLIDVFAVAPDADEAFVAAWERGRDFVSSTEGFVAAALHRAVRSDVEFRFVAVTRFDSAEAGEQAARDPDFPDDTAPFAVASGLYEVVHEDGAPEGAGGVILINPVEVPAEEDQRFLTGWNRAHAALATQRGYLGSRLHRSVAARDFRFIDVGRWSSPLAFARALRQPELQEAAAPSPFPTHPALYQAIRD